MALTDKTPDPDFQVDGTVAAAIRERLQDGLLPCVGAFAAAGALGRPPLEVGQTADALDVHLTSCQLGLFGYPGHAKGWEAAGVAALAVPAGLEDALRQARDERGEVSCLSLWRAAERFAVSRVQVGYVADRLGLPIRHCQLGAF